MAVLILLLSMAVMQMAAEVKVPKLKLNNGLEIPAFGLGTYLGFEQQGGMVKPKNKEVRDIVEKAIDAGVRHIDTAVIYNTEEEVGEGIRMKIDQGTIERKDVFVTTKLWNTHHKREEVVEALRNSLKLMGLNYVDLYLIHWPMGINEDNSFSDTDYMETWRGMEDVQKLGLAKSIGISNFNKEQIARVLKEGSVKPAVLQIEIHPQIIQSDLVEYAHSEGMVVMGYSPFGSLVMRFGMILPGPKMDDPDLVAIAKKYGKTTAQVVLRWHVDRNIIPIPKTTNPKRLLENVDIFDFQLTKEEIAKINSFNSNTRYTMPSFWQTHPYYPFEKVENPIPNPFAKKQ